MTQGDSQLSPDRSAAEPNCDLIVHSCRLVTGSATVEDGWVAVCDGRILASGSGTAWRSYPAREVVDGSARVLLPGFIDLHCHGAGGHSFDTDHGFIEAALAVHRAHGTTRSVLSLVAAPLDELRVSLGRIAELTYADPLILGSHLEGPFLSPSRCGAHNPAHLLDPTPSAVAGLLEAARGTLRQVTIAPELPGALSAIEQFVAAGVTVAVGHTDADFELTREAFARGATLLTHAFNAMAGIHHRAPGPVMAAFRERSAALEIILDGVHVDPSVARLAFDAAPGRIALVTDAMAATGAGDGRYRLGAAEVTVKAGRAMLAGTDTIAGSTLTQDSALRNAITLLDLSPEAAVQALTSTPAGVLGRRDLGSFDSGSAADLVLLNEEYNVLSVWADGVRQR
ncbi:N-acetylglucosamine-6-phosphate deacetylase [Arthrobacter sp. JZ12]|uniref:N-acetylglucosamine-6-phosphate deacetylase n=1 Tax=Arthrobacter sp. JZ12 TaxID=2654190 RepID=UPI002B4A7350|nr:N-acetylglucosamine-6-phosphate deacetylase [Arthrobacter sp. JZ12]WRH26149.1 N-acetylglucosamine-6-phosphate deacetylase [Arthrobacter sp. JZ12]